MPKYRVRLPDGTVRPLEGDAESVGRWMAANEATLAPEPSGMEAMEEGIRAGSRGLAGARASTQEAINSFLRTLTEPRLPAPTEAPMPGGPFESTAANVGAGLLNPVPQNVPEALALGAGAAAPLVAPAGRILGPLVRAGAPAAAYTGTALAEGQSPLQAGVGGAIAGGAMAVPEAIGGGYRIFRDFLRTRLARDAYNSLTMKDAGPVIDAVAQDIPALAHLVRADKPDSLARLASATPQAKGVTVAESVVKRLRDNVDRDIAQRVGTADIWQHVPALVTYALAKGGRGKPGVAPIEDAQAILIEMKAVARRAQASGEPAASRMIATGTGKRRREIDIVNLARDAEEQYLNILTPDERTAYTKANEQYGKTLDLVDALQAGTKSGGWLVGHERGRGVDMGEFAAYLDEKESALGRFRFPALYEAAHRGTLEMARDVTLSRGAPELQRAGLHIPGTPLFITGRAGTIPAQRVFRAGGVTDPRTGAQDLTNILSLIGTMPLREEGPQMPVQTGRVPRGQ